MNSGKPNMLFKQCLHIDWCSCRLSSRSTVAAHGGQAPVAYTETLHYITWQQPSVDCNVVWSIQLVFFEFDALVQARNFTSNKTRSNGQLNQSRIKECEESVFKWIELSAVHPRPLKANKIYEKMIKRGREYRTGWIRYVICNFREQRK